MDRIASFGRLICGSTLPPAGRLAAARNGSEGDEGSADRNRLVRRGRDDASVVAFLAVGRAGRSMDFGPDFTDLTGAARVKILGHQAETVRDRRVPGDTHHLAERR